MSAWWPKLDCLIAYELRVTSCGAAANRIYLGNEKGNVLVFDLNQGGSGLGECDWFFCFWLQLFGLRLSRVLAVVEREASLVSKQSITKKPIDQLAIIKELNALVCLSGQLLTLAMTVGPDARVANECALSHQAGTSRSTLFRA